MKEWIPIPGTNKDALLKAALEEFSNKGYEGANITELASKANMTTGAVYHHFGSKANLYEVIRSEMEQRILDRMEGAVSLFEEDTLRALEAALITGLDFAVKQQICRLVSEIPPYHKQDKIKLYLASVHPCDMPVELMLISSWRSLLMAIANDEIDVNQGKSLIKWLFKKGSL